MSSALKVGDPVWVKHGGKTPATQEWRRGVITEMFGPVCKVSISVNDQGKSEVHAKIARQLKYRKDDHTKPED
jgi:hypothetical protein